MSVKQPESFGATMGAVVTICGMVFPYVFLGGLVIIALIAALR